MVLTAGESPVWRTLTRENLPAHHVRYLHKGEAFEASVSVVEVGGRLAVVKDFNCRPRWFRGLAAAWFIRREVDVYGRLQGVRGIPRLYGCLDRLAFVYEFIDGTPVTRVAEERLDIGFFGRLYDLVHAIHSRGVAHGDLKRRTNILLTEDGHPNLVDFMTAVCDGGRRNPFRRWLFRQMCQVDLNGIAKLKRRVAPHLLTAEDRRRLAEPLLVERLVRGALGR